MTNVLHGLVAATTFAAVGVALLLGGFLLVDLLTPGRLRHQIWTERNANASIFLSSALVGVGAICFTSIITTYDDLLVGLFSTAVFGVLGMVLMAVAFLIVDLVTPGRLGEILVDAKPHPAVWVSAATNVAVAAIVCASIS
ncbi:hypothetical protein Cs7R123_65310 [Catellatospora sp. TT07R-123]|uniref:DUF350 domain-containing protein n=1 Tax=Catellatospora sp. TT07R-123 TaxID=2733863 RepID=UPI001B01BAB9|nr:DUF350 domain-containing protein [Catellatospora sp. TT07R-123]GHJ49189.1 hypothetical protein Cs7R123_65310 [Catellatospora sp. TT07R-123]